MEKRTLGRTGLEVSIAGLGTGGPAQLGQKAGLAPKESARIVRVALDLGINVFDSSPSYGESERLLGIGLSGVRRDRFVVATKFQPHAEGRLKDDPQALMEQLDESLIRLGVDAIDVLQYHGVKPSEYREVIERFQPVALKAQEQGKVRFLGITETVAEDPEHRMLEVALADGIHDTCMVHYGILNQGAHGRLFALAREYNVGVFCMAPVRTSLRTPAEAMECIQGFIENGWVDGLVPTKEDPLGLGSIGQPTADTTRVGYLFASAAPEISTVLMGTSNVDHLRANVDAVSSEPLDAKELDFLRQRFGRLAWNH